MTIKEQIKFHHDNKKFCKIKRQITEKFYKVSNGYITESSDNFILMQEVENFNIVGYLVFPISNIVKIQFNNNDKYYDKIMKLENQIKNISNKHKINLESWTTIFQTIKKAKLNVIVENENPESESFNIGPIIKTTPTQVHIQYFDAKGYLDKETTKINFNQITIINFDDNYTNTFSKYLRQRK